MLIGEPPTSDYDLNFQFLGYRVRVTWGFWVLALILGWNHSRGLDALAAAVGMDSPGAPVLLLIWVAAVFLSIFVHELGHSYAMTYYRMPSRIVLYHFGGIAIPEFGAWNAGRARQAGPAENVVIFAAGPIAQLALAGFVWAVAYAMQVKIILFGYVVTPGDLPSSAALLAVLEFLIWPSVFWAVLNLIPIIPLDGGQITKNILYLTRVQNPTQVAHMISVGSGVAAGLYFMTTGNVFGAIMFFMFAAQNWQWMQYGGMGGYQ